MTNIPSPTRYAKGWLIDFYHPVGVRHRRQFPFSQYADPEQSAKDWARSIIQKEPDTPNTGDIGSRIWEYLNWKAKVKRVKPVTLRADRQRLTIFLDWCRSQKIHTLNSVTVKTFRAFAEFYAMNAPFSGERHRNSLRFNPRATWQKYRQICSALFVWAMKRDYMTTNPAADDEFREKVESKIPEIFTADELHALFTHFDMLDNGRPPWIGAAFRFLAYTGCRPGEMWSLRWDKVDLPGRVVRFTDTKTRRDRIVPIHDELVGFIDRLPRGAGLVWDNGKGGQLYQESGWWKILDRAIRETGLAKTAPRNLYTFRHTFCANLCLAGVSITVVKTLMGHSNIQTTMRYAEHFYRDDRSAAIAKLPY